MKSRDEMLPPNLAESQARLVAAKARSAEIAADLEAGRVVPIDTVIQKIGTDFGIVRQRLLALPHECALSLAAATDPNEAVVTFERAFTKRFRRSRSTATSIREGAAGLLLVEKPGPRLLARANEEPRERLGRTGSGFSQSLMG